MAGKMSSSEQIAKGLSKGGKAKGYDGPDMEPDNDADDDMTAGPMPAMKGKGKAPAKAKPAAKGKAQAKGKMPPMKGKK